MTKATEKKLIIFLAAFPYSLVVIAVLAIRKDLDKPK